MDGAGPRLYRISEPFAGRLAVSERPMGFTDLEDEARAWRQAGLDAVVSMLEDEEAEAFGLAHQAEVCAAAGLELIRCPIGDHGVPDDVEALITALDRALAHLDGGGEVAAHCFAGIGRSPLFVTAVMVRCGIGPDDAWQRVSLARAMNVPDTRAQKRWIADRAAALRRPG